MNTQGFSYWVDGMPVFSVCCLIVLIVFVCPPKANTKNLPCMIGNQISGERYVSHLNALVCLEWCAALIMTPELFPLLFLHTAHMILLPRITTSHYKDNVSNRLPRAALHYCALHLGLISLSVLIWCFFPINCHLPPYPLSRTMTEQRCRLSGIRGGVGWGGPELLGRRGRWG